MATLLPSLSSDEEDNNKIVGRDDDDSDEEEDDDDEGEVLNRDFSFGGILVRGHTTETIL